MRPRGKLASLALDLQNAESKHFMLACRWNLSRDGESFELRKGPTIIGALALLARVCCSATPVAPLFLWGCASTAEEPANAHDAGNPLEAEPADDAASETPPREENPITLTLLPFWEIPVDSGGFGTPVPLAGAKVCVARKRRYSEPWDSFVSVDGPCTTTEANEKVVLEGVPALSELVLTAEKDGFVPRAIPVTSGQWDLGVGIPDDYQLHLFRRENFSALAPNADLTRGQLVVLVFESDLDSFALIPLKGVRVSLEPEVGAPTFYRGGVAVPDASVTLAGDAPGQGSDARGWPFALFTNLPQGEYAVRLERDDRRCRALIGGWSWYAYSDSRENAIRAPVLRDHFTVVAAFCECLVPPGATSCPAPDGGAASQ